MEIDAVRQPSIAMNAHKKFTQAVTKCTKKVWKNLFPQPSIPKQIKLPALPDTIRLPSFPGAFFFQHAVISACKTMGLKLTNPSQMPLLLTASRAGKRKERDSADEQSGERDDHLFKRARSGNHPRFGISSSSENSGTKRRLGGFLSINKQQFDNSTCGDASASVKRGRHAL